MNAEKCVAVVAGVFMLSLISYAAVYQFGWVATLTAVGVTFVGGLSVLVLAAMSEH